MVEGRHILKVSKRDFDQVYFDLVKCEFDYGQNKGGR